jgi:hypothetical protein
MNNAIKAMVIKIENWYLRPKLMVESFRKICREMKEFVSLKPTIQYRMLT